MINYIITAIIVLVIDIIWLYLNRKNYNNLVIKIQGSKIQLNLLGALISYPLIIAGLFIFAIPLIKYEYQKNKKQSLLLLSLFYGGLLGLVIYGVFNGSNIGIFKNYDLKIAFMDTIWGFCLYSFGSYLFMKLEGY